MQEFKEITRKQTPPPPSHQPLQGFQSRKLTKTIQTPHMTDFNPLTVHLFLFPLPQNLHTYSLRSSKISQVHWMSRCLQVCSPWHDIHNKLHLNLELASTNPMALLQTLQDVKPNNLAPSLKIHTAYLGIDTVCTKQLELVPYMITNWPA